jgi:tetratricopeptide (TPR) repeat protein
MSFLALKTPLDAGERAERRRLIISDSLALVTLFAITAGLAVMTNYLYQSYASHQITLARRWLVRGDQALRDNKPQVAIDALSSALAYAPGDRSTEIKLAEALASAGRVQEASVYFNTLLESQQGNGLINLQLARLAARQGNENEAIQDYQRAIYGNWEGDGYVRRRDVRFELINYLISRGLLDQARSELLVAQGNAPEDDLSVQLEVAATMEKAQDPADALHLYRTILRHHGTLREALAGAGRSAFQLGRYLEAKHYLTRSLEGSSVEQEPSPDLEQSRKLLAQTTQLLQLYPSPRLSVKEQSARILSDRKLALARLAQCMQTDSAAPAKVVNATPAPTPAGGALASPLKSLASHFSRHAAEPANGQTAAPAPADPLQVLQERWQELPAKITAPMLSNDPELTQAQLQLIYDTEITTRQVCGAPTGDDDFLLKIAQAPNQVEEE